MKNLFILLLLLALGACESRVVKVLSTNEKVTISDDGIGNYEIGDTVVIIYNRKWKLDQNWIQFEGNKTTYTLDSYGYSTWNKAVIIE